MSDFERRREKNKEELVKIRKENIAKYFFDPADICGFSVGIRWSFL